MKLDWPSFRLCAGYAEVPVRAVGGVWLWAKVDYDDLHLVADLKWYENNGYAYNIKHVSGHKRSSKTRTRNISMHRLIMGTPPEPRLTVDHRYHETLDNRKSELFWTTNIENCNRTRVALKGYRGDAPPHEYRGVKPAKERGWWRVNVGTVYYGQYRDKIVAAKVYDRVCSVRYPKYGRELNFPEDPLPMDFCIPNLDKLVRRAVKSSEWTGVSWFSPKGKWRVLFKGNSRGYFDLEESAIDRAKQAWGEQGLPYPGKRKVSSAPIRIAA